ncbi:unnamed protein product [Adineta ricciae]|uniref:Uncharacterized protein n=1 Tax=Adineta ricciae TaxID=249248 RepID=A0A815CRK5_ADIRI|nr:unnamed protein product [Adineta ricciae]CAF1568917.1 unnamed protein product [Adineta ricciae]
MLCKTIFVWMLVGFASVENKSPISPKTDSFHHQKSLVLATETSSKMIRCLKDCSFEFPLNSSLVIPSQCESYVQSKACAINFGIDYVTNMGIINFDGDNDTDVVFDASLKATARFTSDQSDKHVNWRYVCMTDNDCNSNYFTKYASYYLETTKQVQNLYSHLYTYLYNNGSSASVQQCYKDPNSTVGCQDGMCEYIWDDIMNHTAIYNCKPKEKRLEIFYRINEISSMNTITKTIQMLFFICDIDGCNSPENAIAVRKAIEDNWLDGLLFGIYLIAHITECDNNRVTRLRANSTSGANGTLAVGGNGAGNTTTQPNYSWTIHYATSVSIPGVQGSNTTLSCHPIGIKIDSFINIDVAGNGSHRIQMFCRNNKTSIMVAGEFVGGNSLTQLVNPDGVVFDSSLTMYVIDVGNQRIQKFLKF